MLHGSYISDILFYQSLKSGFMWSTCICWIKMKNSWRMTHSLSHLVKYWYGFPDSVIQLLVCFYTIGETMGFTQFAEFKIYSFDYIITLKRIHL